MVDETYNKRDDNYFNSSTGREEEIAKWLREANSRGFSTKQSINFLLQKGYGKELIRNSIDKIYNKKTTFVILALAIIVGIIAVYLTFFHSPVCSDFECFKNAMSNCIQKTSYINEESEASWKYTIIKKDINRCDVEVKLLQTKAGELGIDKLNGKIMICSFALGYATYPEKELSLCHGELKEMLQEIIIDKLHVNVIENLGRIDEGLNSA